MDYLLTRYSRIFLNHHYISTDTTSRFVSHFVYCQNTGQSFSNDQSLSFLSVILFIVKIQDFFLFSRSNSAVNNIYIYIYI